MAATLNRQRASGSGAQGGGAGYVIENSLRFNDNDSAYLSFTKGAPTDGSKGVMGVWLKRSNISLSAISTIVYGSPGESTRIEITNGTDVINIADDGVQCLETNHVFRDPTAWFHLLLSYDSDEGTAANRLKMFLNGVEITSFAADGRSNIASGEEWGLLVNGGVQQWGFGAGAGTYWDGYMAQAFIIDGTSIQNGDYAVSDFIDTDSNGNPIPIDIVEVTNPTFGNNGSLLDFSVAPGTGFGAGTDVSGGFSLNIIDDTQTYTASSETNGAASNAADGSSGTSWGTATGSGVDNWWAVDLGSGNEKAVIRVEMDFSSDAYTTDLKIYGSDTDAGTGPEAEPATLLYQEATLSLSNNTTFSFDFSNNTTAYRYYWVHIDNAGAGNANVKDFRFYTTGDFGLNHFTESGLAANDRVSDSPTDSADDGIGNYCTLNPISPVSLGGSSPLRNGNLDMRATGGGEDSKIGTIGVSSGKYYWECVATDTNVAFGVASQGTVNSGDMKSTSFTSGFLYGTGSEAYGYNGNTGNKIDDDNSTSYGNTYTTEIIGVALDLDNGAIWFSKAGVWQNATTDSATTLAEIVAGTTTDAAFSDLTSGEVFYPLIAVININQTYSVNFGQQAFNTAAPTGFKALNTANLPAPAIAEGTKGFVGVSGLGSGIVSSLASAISTAGWGSDGYISAYRDHATGNSWQVQFESIDGDALNSVHFNTTAATGAIDAFNSSGTYSAMAWRIGTAYGCYAAKVTHTNGVATDTAHGLGSGAKVGIIKGEDVAGSWWMVHPGNTSGNTIAIDQTVAQTATQHVDVDATNITIAAAEASGDYYVIVFEEKSGLLSIGTHEGNANADGPYIYTDGTPALHWSLNIDSGASNRMSHLYADDSTNAHELAGNLDTTGAYVTTSDIDMLGGGVKIRHASGNQGNNAVTHITLTWLSVPFGGLNVSQARAR